VAKAMTEQQKGQGENVQRGDEREKNGHVGRQNTYR
jgi:hypothetical protein